MVARSAESNPEALSFSEAILERLGEQPPALFDTGNGFPTVLYFPSDRGIRRPPEHDRAVTRPEAWAIRSRTGSMLMARRGQRQSTTSLYGF